MKYTVTYSCGHTETVQLFGPTSERERKLAWYADYGLCPACYKAQKEAERKAEADKLATVYTVPALTGTERQIAWAETLRDSWLKEIEEYIARYGANEPERTAIETALSSMEAMSERFRGFRSNGVTLYGYLIPDLITLRLLCDLR